jgi:hypothetical protein
MTLDTAKTPIGNQKRETGIRWPVTVLTRDGQIEGETENICPAGMVIFSKESPPSDERFPVVIQAPNCQPLKTTAKVVMTRPCGRDDRSARLRTLIHFDQISQADRNFLCRVITKHYERKIQRAPAKKRIETKAPVVPESRQNHPPQPVKPRLRVLYNREGITVEAWGSRFSTRGCHIHSKIPLPAGTLFSLKILHPRTEEPIPVDGSVTSCKHFESGDKWGMAIRFMNLANTDKQKMRQMLEELSTTPMLEQESKDREDPMGQTSQRYFNLKRLFSFIK